MSLISKAGGLLNDLTGATSAGKQNQKYALQSAQVNNAYQKEFAQNAHQWEVEDLKKSGLNPVLSANSGASASGGGVSSGTVSNSGINPIETAIGAWNGYEQALNTGADTSRKEAETENLDADSLLKHYQTLTEIEKGKLTAKQRELIETQKLEILKTLGPRIKQIEAETELTKAQKEKTYTEEEKEFEESLKTRSGLIGTIFGSSPLTRKKARQARTLRNR